MSYTRKPILRGMGDIYLHDPRGNNLALAGEGDSGGDAGGPGEGEAPAQADAVQKLLAQQRALLESQKRTEKLRMIGTGAAVFGVVVGIVRLGDIVQQMRRRRQPA